MANYSPTVDRERQRVASWPGWSQNRTGIRSNILFDIDLLVFLFYIHMHLYGVHQRNIYGLPVASSIIISTDIKRSGFPPRLTRSGQDNHKLVISNLFVCDPQGLHSGADCPRRQNEIM